MSPTRNPKQGKKRARDGKEKPRDTELQEQLPQPQTQDQQTPPCAQPPKAPQTSSDPQTNSSSDNTAQLSSHSRPIPLAPPQQKKHHPKPPREKRQKLPRLPDNAIITKRPIHHPSIPTPFSSSASPKILYITASSPRIPAVKRIRSLLTEISKRSTQSMNSLKPNGRLNKRDVERAIAESSTATKGKGDGKGKEVESVYVKATGRAIERALEIGVYFQNEEDCRVRVQIGSVRAIDDIEMGGNMEKMGEEGEDGANGNEREAMDVEGTAGEKKRQRERKSKDAIAEQDCPEARIRTLSAVTVAISLA